MNMLKIKNILIIVYASLILLSMAGGLVFSQDDSSGLDLEVKYPQLLKDYEPPQTVKTYLPNYIRYLYNFAIASGGIIVFLSLVYGGFRYLTSAGNPGAMADAREQIFSSIIGLVLILGSYVVLREINPKLTTMQLPGLYSARRGIIIYNDGICGNRMGMGNPQLVDFEGMNKANKDKATKPDIYYLALETRQGGLRDPNKKNSGEGYTIGSVYSFHSGGELGVLFFNNDDCQGTAVNAGDAFKIDLDYCSENLNLTDIKCIRLLWRVPGVYVFNIPGGNPVEPKPKTYAHYIASTDGLITEVYNKVRSISLVKSSDYYFGAILHDKSGSSYGGNRGWADIYLPIQGKDITYYEIAENATARQAESLTVFKLPNNPVDAEEDTTIITRNESMGGQFNTKAKWVIPQISIKWSGGDINLDDKSPSACDGAKFFDFADIKGEYPPANAGKYSLNNSGGIVCGGEKIIGGRKLYGEQWKDEHGGLADLLDNEIPLQKQAGGVRGIYLPPNNNYIALLVHQDADSVGSPEQYIRSSTQAETSEAVVFNNQPSLTQIRWPDYTQILLLIRQANVY